MTRARPAVTVETTARSGDRTGGPTPKLVNAGGQAVETTACSGDRTSGRGRVPGPDEPVERLS